MMIIRYLDRLLGLVGLLLTAPLQLLILMLGYWDTGSPLFIQERVGRNKKPFRLFKFRTMKLDTESVATHLANADAITRLGRFLRKTKLDELPQLVNVVRGDMSLVGPRPCLFNQTDLIHARERHGVFAVLPGITGLAQVNGIDMSEPEKLASWDREMIQSLTLSAYFRYIFLTVFGRGSGDRVRTLQKP